MIRRRFQLIAALRFVLIVAAIGGLDRAVCAGGGELARPKRVVAVFANGRSVELDVIAWDMTGALSTTGRVMWRDMAAPDAWHMCAQLIDVNAADDWLTMARALERLPDGKPWARRAAQWSVWLSMNTLVESGKLLKAMGYSGDPAAEVPAAGELERGGIAHRDDDEADRHVGPWPALTEDERARAVDQLKSEMTEISAALDVAFHLAENSHFLFYTNDNPEDVQPLLEGVNLTYESLARSFGLSADSNLFWGKCVIIFCADYELFADVQRKVFRSSAVAHMGGMTHTRGQKTYVVFWKYPEKDKLLAVVPHEITHAFLHRYRTPVQLPLWFEEGLADYMAANVMIDSPMDAQRRPTGERFLRTHGPVNALLDMRCLHDGWPGPGNAGYAVSYLLVRMMFEKDPERTLAFINAVKDGKPWEQALAEDFGIEREQLVKELYAQYRAPKSKPADGVNEESESPPVKESSQP